MSRGMEFRNFPKKNRFRWVGWCKNEEEEDDDGRMSFLFFLPCRSFRASRDLVAFCVVRSIDGVYALCACVRKEWAIRPGPRRSLLGTQVPRLPS